MSNANSSSGRNISRTSTGPGDPYNSLLQLAGISAGQRAGFNVPGQAFGTGQNFSRDVFGGNGQSSTGTYTGESAGRRYATGGGNVQTGEYTGGPLGGRGGKFGGNAQIGLFDPDRTNPRDGNFGGGQRLNNGSPGLFGGSNLIGQGQQYVSDTLAGNYLNSNPYLDQTFNRAADLTRGRLASEFAGSGRDLAASAPARSDELQTLASNIYGGNFQAERDRQGGILGFAGQYDPLNQFISQLGQIVPLGGNNVVTEGTGDQSGNLLQGLAGLFG